MQCDCVVIKQFIQYCDLHEQDYERRIHGLVEEIKKDKTEPLWNPVPSLTERVYDRYQPVNCHASMVVSNSTYYDNPRYQQKCLEHSVDMLLDKLFKEAKQFVQLNVKDSLYGKEMSAELGVFKREIKWDSSTGLIGKDGDLTNLTGENNR